MLRKLLVFTLTLTLLAGALELFVRQVILRRDFLFVRVTPDQFPYFRLVDSYQNSWLTIKNGRREALPRGERPHRVAFVGDSVTFCATVSDENCFVEQLQKNQSLYDAYNFGVPGYGLPEIESVVSDVLSKNHYDVLVYVLNFNDVTAAQPVLLSLLASPERRFATIDNYTGRGGQFRGWLKDNLKFVPAGKYLLGVLAPKIDGLFSRTKQNSENELEVAAPVLEENQTCHEQVVEELHHGPSAFLYNRTYPAWQKMYRDPKLMDRYSKILLNMKNISEKRGTRFLVVPFHDLVFFTNNDRGINDIILNLLKKNRIDTVDTYPLIAADYKACGMYRDPGHPGWFGNRLLEKSIGSALSKRYFSPPPSHPGSQERARLSQEPKAVSQAILPSRSKTELNISMKISAQHMTVPKSL